ncbi:MAG: hypothetical protein L0Y72_27315 [Gemmataceae bacterium]|nr:hypothetical protein [Gemmataceae bacterium]MCI0742761.1 hypothetical protein [Gemmataceae bacterium]
MRNKLIFALIVAPVALAAWLTFSAPQTIALSPDSVIGFELPSTNETMQVANSDASEVEE